MTTTDTLTPSPADCIEFASGRAVSISRLVRGAPDEFVLQARSGDEVVGCACFEFEPGGRIGHLTVSVSPEWRNEHLGRQLLERIVEEARALGLEYLVGRYPEVDVAANRMFAASGCVVARRTGDGMVRFAVSVRRALAA